MATTAKEDAQPPMLLAVKFHTELLEAGHPVSFHACANKLGSVGRHSASILQLGRHIRKPMMIWHGLHLRRIQD
jgi:hypothetical protein